jgi:hypothetical protein
MEEKMMDGCTHNCHTCSAGCDTDGEKKVNFFEKMEEISTKLNDIGEENILNILNEAIEQWEAEDAEEEAAKAQEEA